MGQEKCLTLRCTLVMCFFKLSFRPNRLSHLWHSKINFPWTSELCNNKFNLLEKNLLQIWQTCSEMTSMLCRSDMCILKSDSFWKHSRHSSHFQAWTLWSVPMWFFIKERLWNLQLQMGQEKCLTLRCTLVTCFFKLSFRPNFFSQIWHLNRSLARWTVFKWKFKLSWEAKHLLQMQHFFFFFKKCFCFILCDFKSCWQVDLKLHSVHWNPFRGINMLEDDWLPTFDVTTFDVTTFDVSTLDVTMLDVTFVTTSSTDCFSFLNSVVSIFLGKLSSAEEFVLSK